MDNRLGFLPVLEYKRSMINSSRAFLTISSLFIKHFLVSQFTTVQIYKYTSYYSRKTKYLYRHAQLPLTKNKLSACLSHFCSHLFQSIEMFDPDKLNTCTGAQLPLTKKTKYLSVSCLFAFFFEKSHVCLLGHKIESFQPGQPHALTVCSVQNQWLNQLLHFQFCDVCLLLALVG